MKPANKRFSAAQKEKQTTLRRRKEREGNLTASYWLHLGSTSSSPALLVNPPLPSLPPRRLFQAIMQFCSAEACPYLLWRLVKLINQQR